MRVTFLKILSFALALFAVSCFIDDRKRRNIDPGPSKATKADLEVFWTVDGKKNADVCSLHKVATWAVTLAGPESAKGDVACGKGWDTAQAFYALKPGIYEIKIEARDAGSVALATRQKRVQLTADNTTIWTATIDFLATDFRPGAAGQLAVAWKINGTVDGSAAGPSWDSCAEVGASKVAITIDGKQQLYECDNSGQMQVVLKDLATGGRDVTVKLLDKSGAALTTEAKDTLAVGQQRAEFTADFYFDSFFKKQGAAIKGDYIFKTLYEESCADVGASRQTILLKDINGAIVDGRSCKGPEDTLCLKTDGKSDNACQPSFDNQTIGGLVWGIYKLELGGLASAASTACWQSKAPKSNEAAVEILVGAGTENPVVTHDLGRVANSACP